MSAPPLHVVVPVKAPDRAKGRLARFLSPEARRDLALAMLQDVLTVVGSNRSVRRLWVISHDREVLSTVEAFGAVPLEEKFDMGLNRALRLAGRTAEEHGAGKLLILHSDVPLIRPADLASLIRAGRNQKEDHPLVLAVPSKEGTGTNALLRNPPNVIPPCFGRDSLRRHAREAARRKVPFRVCKIPRLAMDIDTPKDLIALLPYRRPGHTLQLLQRLGLL